MSEHTPSVSPDLGSFLSLLEREDELRKVSASVDPLLEIGAITQRVSRLPAPHPGSEPDLHPFAALGGRALLFESVKGSDIPVVMNAYGSYWRVCQALGVASLGELASRVEKLLKPEVPVTLWQKLQKIPELIKLAGYPPKSVKTGPCQDRVYTGNDADLGMLPVIQCWPLDGDIASDQLMRQEDRDLAGVRGTGRYFTLGCVHTRHPETGVRNVGMYRVQVFSPRLCAMHWHTHHDGARHFRAWQARGEKMPIAITLGGESVLPYCATAPLPPGVDELILAGFLAGSGIELVPCRSVDMEVPANSEIVIEGYVDPQEKLLEGPFGDHTGFYSLADWYPAMHVTAITTRKKPIFPATIVGRAPMEDYYLGKATERLFLPMLRLVVPDVLDYSLPASGAFHNCAFIKIRKEYAGQARRVMHAIWGAGQMCFTKFIVVVDEDVNVHDEQDVWFHLFANCDPRRDSEVVTGPVDILDHASPHTGLGSKIGFDATRKLPEEGQVRRYPRGLGYEKATAASVDARWREYFPKGV